MLDFYFVGFLVCWILLDTSWVCFLTFHRRQLSLNSSPVCLSHHHHENCQQISGRSSGENLFSLKFNCDLKNDKNLNFFNSQTILYLPPPTPHTHQLALSASCLLFLLRKLPPNKSLQRKPQIFGDSKSAHKSVNPEERVQ